MFTSDWANHPLKILKNKNVKENIKIKTK